MHNTEQHQKPLVKKSEMSRVLTTRDYALFTVPDHTISTKFLNQVKESIQFKDLTKDYPILVNSDYVVLDGKYRFLASYQLGIDIHYKMAEVATMQDVVRVKQIHKQIPIIDVLKIYSDLTQYNNMLLLFDEFGEHYSHSEILRSTCVCQYKGNGISRSRLQSGQMENYDYEAARQRLQNFIEVGKMYNIDASIVWSLFESNRYTDDYGNKIGFDRMNPDDIFRWEKHYNLILRSLHKAYDFILNESNKFFMANRYNGAAEVNDLEDAFNEIISALRAYEISGEEDWRYSFQEEMKYAWYLPRMLYYKGLLKSIGINIKTFGIVDQWEKVFDKYKHAERYPQNRY